MDGSCGDATLRCRWRCCRAYSAGVSIPSAERGRYVMHVLILGGFELARPNS